MQNNEGYPILECMHEDIIKYAKEKGTAIIKCKNCNFRDPCKQETLYFARLKYADENWNGSWKVGELTILTKKELNGFEQIGLHLESTEVKVRKDSVHWSNWFPGNYKVLKLLEENGIDTQETIKTLT